MTKLELLNVFLNDRLTAAADEIFCAIKDTVVEYQSEILRSKEENERLKRLLNIAVQRLLLHSDPNSIQLQDDAEPSESQNHAQEWSSSLVEEHLEPTPPPPPPPQPPEIKEEPELDNTEKEDPDDDASTFGTKGLISPSLATADSGRVEPPQGSHLLPAHAVCNRSSPREGVSSPRTLSRDVKVEDEEEENGTHQSTSSLIASLAVDSNFRAAQSDCHSHAAHINRTVGREKQLTSQGLQSKDMLHTNGKQHAHVLYAKNMRPLKPPLPQSSHPGQSTQKWHCCRECGKCFSFACQLEVHMRWHTKEKPYSCTVCRKSFTTVSMLKRHHRIHTGEKPFRCHVCGKCFNQSAHLNTHFRLHTGERARWRQVLHSK